MSDLEMRYQNERESELNDAGHYDGKSGFHHNTSTMYSGGSPVYSAIASTDHYDYHRE